MPMRASAGPNRITRVTACGVPRLIGALNPTCPATRERRGPRVVLAEWRKRAHLGGLILSGPLEDMTLTQAANQEGKHAEINNEHSVKERWEPEHEVDTDDRQPEGNP